MQKLLIFFSKKFQHICVSLDVNFNELLTNDVVSFEQLGPGNNIPPRIVPLQRGLSALTWDILHMPAPSNIVDTSDSW